MTIPETFLKNKKILIGVSGSIAIYKTLDLIRLFIKSGADVKVVMSQSAKKFITPLSFEAISANEVLHEESENWHNNLNHIAFAKWADLFIIAPASVNTINKLSNGLADNLMLQVAIAYPKLKLIAPSSNTQMMDNPLTKASLKMLKLANYEILESQTKLLVCNTKGNGAMAEPETIFWYALRALFKEEFWENRRAIVSAGGTREKIDEVRYISNFSSGKMGSNLALSLFIKGADVCFISTEFPEQLPTDMCIIDVENTEEMLEYIIDSIRIAKKGILTKATLMNDSVPQLIQKEPFLFMSAAISDYIPMFPQSGKIKSKDIGEKWNLNLKENVDILKTINKEGIKTIGFKAEIDQEKGKEYAKKMLIDKNLDAVCLNILKNSSSFGSDDNEIELIFKDKYILLPKNDKFSLSLNLLEELKNK
jgi:phosphopantothenoylcysteine decarboxylase/phosphopantothenate--cysteine ligase